MLHESLDVFGVAIVRVHHHIVIIVLDTCGSSLLVLVELLQVCDLLLKQSLLPPIPHNLFNVETRLL